jgi:hypothetical protein
MAHRTAERLDAGAPPTGVRDPIRPARLHRAEALKILPATVGARRPGTARAGTCRRECAGVAMFVEQRLYTFAPGKSAEFNALYEAEGRAPQERHLGLPVGYYYSEIGPLNQVMTLWAYPTLNDRVERRARLFKDPQWISFLAKARPLLVTQECRILRPADFFKNRLESIVEMGRTPK